MTTRFRIDELRLETSGGPVSYSFPSDLTVLAGPTGVGKTALLELIKYALGGDGLITSVAEEHISQVHISVQAGAEKLRLSRGIAPAESNTVEVTDLLEGQRLVDHHVARQEPSISDLLLDALGLPTGLRAAPRSAASTRAGAKVPFNDIFRFMYVSQLAINREIAGSSNRYYEPKRRTVFELLFGLTTPELVTMRSELNELNSQAAAAETEVAAVERFLVDSGTTSKIEADLEYAEVQRSGAAARSELAELTSSMVDVADRETQALRDLLAESERGLTEAQSLVSEFRREQAVYLAERRRVQLDVGRLERLMSAGARMASIEFTTCPRCLQSLDREVPLGRCRVCTQDDIVADLPHSGQYELNQLASQLEEVDAQLGEIDVALAAATEAVTSRQRLVQRLTVRIDERTRDRVSPRLQAYADAARRAERSLVQAAALERVLRQWDRVEDLRVNAERLRTERRSLDTRIRSMEAAETARRTDVLGQLAQEFQTTVNAFGIPNGQNATINPTTYLPELNGRPFEKVSSAGGIATATQVAYWMSLVTVAARLRDTKFPGFLLIDSPRMALNTAEGMAREMYRRFVTQVDVLEGRFQFIIADNELPAAYGRDFDEITFTIDNPTVPTVPHPGPANVKLVGQEEELTVEPTDD